MDYEKTIGNRITDNAHQASDGRVLVEKGLRYVQGLGWESVEESQLFSGVYYDSKKMGSYITRIKNSEGRTAVLKLQLHPLPFDEGHIIRHISGSIGIGKVRLPLIIADEPWDDKKGFGYLIFEDLTHLPDLWSGRFPLPFDEKKKHAQFLKEFMEKALSVKPFLEKPTGDMKAKYRDMFHHFQSIARSSSYHHIAEENIDRLTKIYFTILEKFIFPDIHFTHAHLSGFDIKHDKQSDVYYLMANLYWSWRAKYSEFTFPIWVEVQNVRNKNFEFQDLLKIVNEWNDVWKDVFKEHVAGEEQYWFNLLERSMMTCMLDLGASEWKKDEIEQKQALLNAWQEFFFWIAENKFGKK